MTGVFHHEEELLVGLAEGEALTPLEASVAELEAESELREGSAGRTRDEGEHLEVAQVVGGPEDQVAVSIDSDAPVEVEAVDLVVHRC